MKKGFTLIEMVLVMGIVVILFLLTMPNIQKTLQVVHKKGCDAQLKIVDAAILQYQLKNDSIPNDINSLVAEGFLSNRQKECSDGTSIKVVDGQAQL